MRTLGFSGPFLVHQAFTVNQRCAFNDLMNGLRRDYVFNEAHQIMGHDILSNISGKPGPNRRATQIGSHPKPGRLGALRVIIQIHLRGCVVAGAAGERNLLVSCPSHGGSRVRAHRSQAPCGFRPKRPRTSARLPHKP